MSDLKQLTSLVRRAIALENEIEASTGETKILSAERDAILCDDIPAMFLQLGLQSDTKLNVDGRTVGVKGKFTYSVAEGRKAAAFEWLDRNGHGGMLSRVVRVRFGKKSEAEATALAKILSRYYGDDAEVSVETDVAPATLRAFLGELLREGQSIPEATFGLRPLVQAVISANKQEDDE